MWKLDGKLPYSRLVEILTDTGLGGREAANCDEPSNPLNV